MGQAIMLLLIVGAFGLIFASKYRLAVGFLLLAAFIFSFQMMVAYIHTVRDY
jgi:hypothetical protein